MTSERTWIFGDYRQAEAMVVAWKGPVPTLKEWFRKSEDTHLNLARLIGKTVQENRIRLPKSLFGKKHWSQLSKLDKDERQIGKNCNHANNYGVGVRKFALMTGLPEKFAGIIQEIHFSLFPEIKSGYQAGIIFQLRKDRTITLPQGWKRTFYDAYGPDLERAAFAFYGQGTIGLLLIETLRLLCEHFQKEIPDNVVATPHQIRNCGFDVQLQVHDSIGISCPNDPETISYTVKKIKEVGERPLLINGEELIVPLDFKIGSNWGELKDYEPK